MTTINIAKEYTRVPGPRYKAQGPHSGEKFREEILVPAFETARRNREKLIIQLDGVRYGYPTSFLEEAFGGLARKVGVDSVLDVLEFRTTTEPSLLEETRRYIKDALKTSTERADEAG